MDGFVGTQLVPVKWVYIYVHVVYLDNIMVDTAPPPAMAMS